MRLACVLGLLGLGTAQAEAELSGRTLQFNTERGVAWKRQFPVSMGELGTPLAFAGRTYLGVGPAVFAFDQAGRVVGRADLPGEVGTLDSAGGAVRVSTQGDGYTELFTLGEPERNLTIPIQERAVMPPDPKITGWLAHVADQVPVNNLSQAAQDYPANAFLAVREAQRLMKSGDNYGALTEVRRALGMQMPFPAWTQLAQRLDSAGFPGAATLALERAKRDAAARGIDPAIPVSRAALLAYGNPSAYVGTLLAQNRFARAEAWMRFLRELYPRFEGHSALYARYADALDAQGRMGEAEEWRQFDRSLREGSLYNLGPEDTNAVRDAAKLATLALFLTLLAGFLTLAARAWKAQGQDTKAYGGRWGSIWRSPLRRARLNLLNYASLSERLTLLAFSVALVTALAGWQWANEAQRGLNAPALNMGTYGGGWYNAHIDDLNLRNTPDTALLAGLAAQLDGDENVARQSYAQAGEDACALNNLGVISQSRDDAPQARDYYRTALSLRPDLGAAAYNLGLDQHTPQSTFQKTYRGNAPRLCYPDRRNITRMVSGDLSVTLKRDLLSPLDFLSQPQTNHKLNWAIVGSLVLLALMVFLLLVPRAAPSERLGRPAAYRALGLLLPGSTLLGNAWGGMLLLTWGAAVAALLPLTELVRFPLLPGPQNIGVRNILLALLVVTYVLNGLALTLIESRLWRRRRHEGAG